MLRSTPPPIETDVYYMCFPSAFAHAIFGRLAWWITTFLTFERCICITFPLKVKQIISPRRTVLTITGLTFLCLTSMAPLYAGSYIGPRYFPALNKTLYTRIYTAGSSSTDMLVYVLNIIFMFGAALTTSVCTVVIIRVMRDNLKWREITTRSSGSKCRLKSRDLKIIRLVAFIAVIFLVTILPDCANMMAVMLVPEYSYTGLYQNLFAVVAAGTYTLEAINSSVNILVYYSTSSKFRLTLRKMFGCGKSQEVKESCVSLQTF